MAIVGIIAGAGSAAIVIVLNDSIVPGINDIVLAALSLTLLRVAHKKGCYRLCSWIFVIADFFILFPVTFFYCGGYRSGAIFVFVIALVFTAFLLKGRERVAILVFEFILYIGCCLVVFYRPETAYTLPAESRYFFMTMLNFTIACIVLLIVITLCIRLFQNWQKKIDGLISELTDRNEELARYDSMKSDFLAFVAHEINTPLAVITASSNDTIDLLKESPLNMDEIIENQEVIERRAKMISSILPDLMDTVAIESGRLSLNRQPVELSELLINTCRAQFKRLDVNKNRITYNIQPGLPRIRADASRIEQVITNLLSNACRHTQGGLITVSLAQVEGGQAVSVKDNGEGMDAEMAGLLLKEYASTKTDYWRHGIGLAVCRRIIVEHGGELWIDSEKGSGTTISFMLRDDEGYG